MYYWQEKYKELFKYYDRSAVDITIDEYDLQRIAYETKKQVFTYEKYAKQYYAGRKIYPLMVSNFKVTSTRSCPHISLSSLSVSIQLHLEDDYLFPELARLEPLQCKHLDDNGLGDDFKNKLLKELI